MDNKANIYIPHYRAIIALYLSGVPYRKLSDDNIPTIGDVLSEYGFNDIDYNSFFSELEKIDIFSPYIEDIKENEKIYRYNNSQMFLSRSKKNFRTYLFDNEIFDNTFTKECSIEFACRAHKINKMSKRFLVSRVIDILEDFNARTMIETGLMKGIPLEKIIAVYKRSNADFEIKLNEKIILAYSKIFWDCSISSLRRSGSSLNDLWNYLSLDKYDTMYGSHKRLIFSSRENYLMTYGLIEDDHRLNISKKIYGKTSEIILDNLDSNVPIRMDILDAHKHSDSSITLLTREGVDPDKYKREIERIYERLDIVKTQRMSLDELKKDAVSGNIPVSRDDEADTPIFGEREQL